jgi:hypothetical protein
MKKIMISMILFMIAITAINVGAHSIPVQDRVVHKEGVLRIGPGFYFHDDAKHAVLGIEGISLLNGCDLRVALRDKPGDQILSAIAEEDAEMASLGITAGFYGGASSATMEMYRNGNKLCVNDPFLSDKNADVWIRFDVLEA